MVFALLFTLYFAFCGLLLRALVFPKERGLRALWLGLVLGLFGLSWLPALFAFATGRFSLLENLLGALLMGLLAGAGVYYARKQGRCLLKGLSLHREECWPLLALLPLLFIGGYLFSTHILQPKDGSLYVGQTTYGDLAMHLGFISSMARQGTFPPEYSIFPGHGVNYPFLCEASSASMAVLGADLRSAYLIPALYAYMLVLLGVYCLMRQWLKRPWRAVLGCWLFFLGGGFGFAYFLDRLNGSSTLSALLGDTGFATNLSWLLDGYYKTPTNLPEIGLRWVNPIVDMLVPQRATLFGWVFLFPCLYLLHDWAFCRRKESLPGLILLAAGLPLLHTHSFLALGILSGVYCLMELCSCFDKKRFLGWALYGGIVILLAAPQLFGFAFRQAGESGMVRLHLNWANEVDGYLWFYIKNMGWMFLLLLPGLLLLSRRDRRIMAGPLVLWGIGELVVFQPNVYDNNKLLFVWFFYLCGLTAKLLGYLFHRWNRYIASHSTKEERQSLLALLHGLCLLLTCLYALTGFLGDTPLNFRQSGLLTVCLGLLLSAYLSGSLLVQKTRFPGLWTVLCVGESGVFLYLLYRVVEGRSQSTLTLESRTCILLLLLGAMMLAGGFLGGIRLHTEQAHNSAAGAYSVKKLVAFLLAITLFLSGIMTVAREWGASYEAFGPAELTAADYIEKNTDPKAVFLTDYSWHLNPVCVLAGRNIVCGSDLYLYYHGIDTSQRHADIAAMLENPGESEKLFRSYGVSYVYIGSSERYHFAVDTDWFEVNGTLLFDQGGICIYKLTGVCS